MTKTTYIATDAAGAVHMRKTERVYTHTVVVLPNYEHDVANVMSTGWEKHEVNNDRYYRAIAAGNDPVPSQNWAAKNPDKWTPEQIAEQQVHVDKENANRLAKAQAYVAANPTFADYIVNERARRLAAIEKAKAEGHYDRWRNAGWCGRPDLAQKLYNKHAGEPHWAAVDMIEAKVKGAL